MNKRGGVCTYDELIAYDKFYSKVRWKPFVLSEHGLHGLLYIIENLESLIT